MARQIRPQHRCARGTPGAEKLARLVLDEAEQNAAFRKVSRLPSPAARVPTRLQRSWIADCRPWSAPGVLSNGTRPGGFSKKDLSATVKVAAEELGQASPEMAIERLLTSLPTHEKVFDRVDDSHGRVQDVYYTANPGRRRSCIPSRRGCTLPNSRQRVMSSLGKSSGMAISSIWPRLSPLICLRRCWPNGTEETLRASIERMSKGGWTRNATGAA